MSLDPVTNFAKVTVSTTYDDTDTSIVLEADEGAKLPQPSTDGAFNIVWYNYTDYKDPSDDPNKEIVRVTARSTDTLTVTRGQEDVVASTKNTASRTYKMMLAITAKMITDIPLLSVDEFSDVDTVTSAPAKNEVLKWNGSDWVPGEAGKTDEFTYSCSGFDDGLTSPILCGSGEWQAAEAISFTATYLNGPPTTADIQKAVNNTSYSTINAMDGAAYTGGNNTAAIDFPTVDQYIRFRLSSGDGVDTDIDYAGALYFYNYIYYGGDTTGSGFDEAGVEGFDTKVINSSYSANKTLDASSGTKYVVWAYPSRYTSIHASGALFNGITMPFTAPETVSITNTAGLTENYKVFASTDTDLTGTLLQLSTSANLTNNFYYGGSTLNTGWTATQIKELTDVNAPATNDTTQTFNSVTLAASEYYVFAYPTRLTAAYEPSNWFDNGTGFPLSLNAGSPEVVSIENANGYTEDYDVWVSNNVLGPGAFQLRTT